MKKWLLWLMSAILGTQLAFASGGDVVEPESVTITNRRSEVELPLPGDKSYFEETSLLVTNSICFDTNNATQGLDNVIVEFRVGTTESSIPYTGTVYAIDSSTSFWWTVVPVPTNVLVVYCQTKLIDENENIYIYPWKTLRVKEPLK